MSERALKFRVFNTVSKKMSEPFRFLEMMDFCSEEYDGDISFQNSDLPYNWYPIMQFTGLLDSQGREIYEGDILEFNDPEDYERGEIVFKGGAFVYLCEDGSSDYLGDCNTRAMTIIGNRFENPALIAP